MLTLAERLAKHSHDEGNCRIWHGAKKSNGYGCIGLFIEGKRFTRMPHRMAYEVANGPISAGLLVCHSCDNRACINPAHLWLGSYQDNASDMMAKGRQTSGERNGQSRLTAVIALEIYADKRRQRTIAAAYGISQPHVSDIKTGKRWLHVTGHR